MALLSAFGAGFVPAEGKGDDDVGLMDDKCCHLASSTECSYSGSKSNYSCPDGYQKTWWYCCEGTRQVGCGECSRGSHCRAGPFACSIWWWTGNSC